jgi:hypothetical protein
MLLQLTNIDLENIKSYESDIMLNKSLTNISPTNMYEILFNSENFDKIIDLVLMEIINVTKEDFSVYVKNMWGFVQNELENYQIDKISHLKKELWVKPKYTFMYVVKSFETILEFVDKDIIIKEGDLIIFDNEKFIADKSKDINRVILIGSLTNNLYNDNSQKKLL